MLPYGAFQAATAGLWAGLGWRDYLVIERRHFCELAREHRPSRLDHRDLGRPAGQQMHQGSECLPALEPFGGPLLPQRLGHRAPATRGGEGLPGAPVEHGCWQSLCTSVVGKCIEKTVGGGVGSLAAPAPQTQNGREYDEEVEVQRSRRTMQRPSAG